MIFLLAAAVAMQMATKPIDGNWIGLDDYPLSAMRNGEGGYVGFALLIAPDGKPDRCLVTAPVPFADLNRKTCELLMRRARFKPAVDTEGQPAYAVFRSQVTWLTADNPAQMAKLRETYPMPTDVDLTLLVSAAEVPPPIDLVIEVDASNRILACEAQDTTVGFKWIKAACGQILQQWKPISMERRVGQAVVTIQAVKIAFRTQGMQPAAK